MLVFFKYLLHIRSGLKKIYAKYIGIYNEKSYGKIGYKSIIANDSSLVSQNVFIDDYCVIQSQTNFISKEGKLIVKKFSVISSGCIIVPGSHKLTVGVPFYMATTNHINDDDGDIIIDEDCWIGAGCILLPKCHIGRGSVVGAGSVVKKEIPPYAIVAGVPAKIIATKFTLDEIIKHESILYSPEERMSKDELEKLFATYYKGLNSIGEDISSEELLKKIEGIRVGLRMKNYSCK